MSNVNKTPYGATQAILDYGEVLAKLDRPKRETVKTYNNLFNKDIVHQIHKHISSFFGEESIIRDTEQGTFENLCIAPFQSACGQDAYPTVYDKAAKVLEGFATHQVFFEGNKRLAVGATIQFLRSQNIKLTLDKQSMYDLVVEVAKEENQCKFGTINKDVLVGDHLIPEKIANIAKIIRENSTIIAKNKKSIRYIPIGSAKRFNKAIYNNIKNGVEDSNKEVVNSLEL